MRYYSRLVLLVLVSCASARADAPATQPINIEFLQGDTGRAAIVDDSLDPYFAVMEDHEMTAKTSKPISGDTHDAKLTECKKRYQAAVADFSDDEKSVLTLWVTKITPALTRDYPVFGNTRWSFVKTKSSLEGGMAWTRGNHVFLPQGMLAGFVGMNKKMSDKALYQGATLLIHEQTHVLERLHPDLFTPLYTDTLHFVHAKKIEPNAWLKDRQLVNPDGTVCDWIYPVTDGDKKSFVLPLLAFETTTPTDLTSGIGTIAVTLEQTADGLKAKLGADGNPIVQQLSDIPAYMEGPGAEQNNYHPNEIIADRFAELVVIDDLLDADLKKKVMAGAGDKLEARLKPIRDWAKPAFAEAHAK